MPCTDALSHPRRQKTRLALAVLSSCLIASSALAQSLEKRVSNALASARLGTAHVGVSVLDLSTGNLVVNLRAGSVSSEGGRAEEGFIPASNLKLLTSGAALLVLGKDFEFQTQIIADGDRLVVRGAGDPGFAEPRLLDQMHLSVDQFIDRLVQAAQSASVTGLKEVVIDDRVFDRDYVHVDWPKDQLNRAYCAQVSGLNFHANVLNVYVSPGGLNAAPEARVEPAGSWITLNKMARTVRDGNTEVWLERDTAPFSFKLHGTVRSPITEPVQVTVHEPGMFFAKVLADRLAKAGLGQSGTPIAARLAGLDEDLALSPKSRVVTIVRTPIAAALSRCNVDSDNLYAESFCKLSGNKVTGQPGTWGSGTAVVRMQVKDRLGAEAAASLVLADGSGLSRNNRIMPDVMTRWLGALAKDPAGPTFIASLAVAGQDGTVRNRFKGAKLKNEVRAKSGYIRGVRTLSGYITNEPSGRRVAFSILVDNLPSGTDARAKEFHEDVVQIVDQWLFDRCKDATVTAPTP